MSLFSRLFARFFIVAFALVSVVPLASCQKDEKKEEKASKDKDDKDDDDKSDKKSKKKKKGDDSEEDKDKGGKADDDDKPTKKDKGGKGCPAKFNDMEGHDKGDALSCSCEEDKIGGAVWGTDTYTEDSSPCAAAVHAGVIKKSGGSISMKHSKGCDTYSGSARNGITSSGWGKFPGSFYFPDKGDGSCKKSDTCPASFKDIPKLTEDTEITCTCASTATGSGSVWGSDIYTQDSSVCKAAVHVGVITTDGGSVSAKAAPGCKSYQGSTTNGVTSSAWGEYESSFYFPSKSDGICKVAKVATGATWKAGDAVDVQWNGAWYQATVTAVATGPKYKVHYIGYGASWDEWVAPARVRARTATSLKGSLAETSSATSTATWKAGDAVDVLWNGSWWQANVIAAGTNTWKVHYLGYDNSWDEWVGPTRIRARTGSASKGTGSDGASAAPTGTATASGSAWKSGDAVDVLWNGSWWQANVIAVGTNTWKVHYVGYNNSWDEWVGPTRIRARTGGSKKGP